VLLDTSVNSPTNDFFAEAHMVSKGVFLPVVKNRTVDKAWCGIWLRTVHRIVSKKQTVDDGNQLRRAE
jgi:hypothetical protein